MNRFLVLAPAAILTLLSIATPVSAQAISAEEEFVQLRTDVFGPEYGVDSEYRQAMHRVSKLALACKPVDFVEVHALELQADALASRAQELAPRLSGRQREVTLDMANMLFREAQSMDDIESLGGLC